MTGLAVSQLVDPDTYRLILAVERWRAERGQTRRDPLSLAVKQALGITDEAEGHLRRRHQEDGTEHALRLNVTVAILCERGHAMRREMMSVIQRHAEEIGMSQPVAEVLAGLALCEVFEGITSEY